MPVSELEHLPRAADQQLDRRAGGRGRRRGGGGGGRRLPGLRSDLHDRGRPSARRSLPGRLRGLHGGGRDGAVLRRVRRAGGLHLPDLLPEEPLRWRRRRPRRQDGGRRSVRFPRLILAQLFLRDFFGHASDWCLRGGATQSREGCCAPGGGGVLSRRVWAACCGRIQTLAALSPSTLNTPAPLFAHFGSSVTSSLRSCHMPPERTCQVWTPTGSGPSGASKKMAAPSCSGRH